jgi:hypothetical protein
MRRLRGLTLIAALALAGSIATAHADPLTFNAMEPADNAAMRASWLAAAGILSPQYVVDFETGFSNLQNLSGVGGLFPGSLVITDTSTANEAIIRTGAGVINGSNPVGAFSLTHNELAFLELDFSASPVDYVGFLDIDQAGTTGVAILEDLSSVAFGFETTGVGGDSAEFFGLFRNDRPRIVLVKLDASGDGRWGFDNLEYGTIPEAAIPEPASFLLVGTGLAGLRAWRKRRG